MSASPSTSESTYQFLTSPGPAAIAIIRIRGPAVESFIQRHLRARTPLAECGTVGAVRRAELTDADGATLDDMLVSVHARQPTWDLRLHLHGSPWLARRCTELLEQLGFSERVEEVSTLWNTTDTIEAEAYALLPKMVTLAGAQWLMRQVTLLRESLRRLATTSALEAAAEECRALATRAEIFAWFSHPLRVALTGPPNVGKSTLANALVDQPASLVSATPGTTRDWVETPGEACGYPVVWLDTAGLRAAGDELEAAGIARTQRLIEEADAVLVVLDVTSAGAGDRQRFLAEYAELQPACAALNKCDLADPGALRETLPADWRRRAVAISATECTGLDMLAERLVAGVGRDTARLAQPAAFTVRQAQRLEAAATAAEASDRNRFRENVLRCLRAVPEAT